jgi:hypothetical protein
LTFFSLFLIYQREEVREAKRHEPERLPIDDKEGHYIVRPDDLLGDHRCK